MDLQSLPIKKILLAVVAVVVIAAVGFAAMLFLNQQPPAALQVSVTDASGAPLDGATVTIVFEGKTLGTATSADGAASFEKLPSGKRVTVRAEKDGFEGAVQRVTLSQKSEAQLQLVQSAQPTATPSATPAPERFDFIIASRRDRLNAKYGAALAAEIERGMNSLAKAASKDGVAAKVVFLDDKGASFTADGDVAAALVELNASSAHYLLIVGGPKIVSMPQVSSPLAEAPYNPVFDFLLQSDGMVWTDSPYGQGGAAVGRLPDGFEEQSTDRVLVDLLEEATQAHSKKVSFSGVSKLVSQDVFFDFLNHFAFESVAQAATVTPPFSILRLFDFLYVPPALSDLKQKLSQGTVFVALHGNEPQQEQAFIGRESNGNSDYLVLNPAIAQEMDFAGKMIVADSCYGANPQRLVNESLPIKFLREGAFAFIGSTESALSDNKLSRAPFVDEAAMEAAGVANTMTYYSLKRIAAGDRSGDAFVAAKKKLGNREVDRLTAAEFVLYGDPTLRLAS